MTESPYADVCNIINKIRNGSFALYARCDQSRCAPAVIPNPARMLTTKTINRKWKIVYANQTTT